jgi:hypothetical protein
MASKAIHTRILAGGYLISSQTNKAVIKLDSDKTDVTCFEDTAQNFIVQDPKAGIDIGGYIVHTTADADTYDAISHGALATQITVGVIKSTTATMTGGTGYVIPNSNAISLSHDMSVGNVMALQASWGGASAMKRGKVPYAGVAISATGTKPSIDLGAQGTTGGAAYLFVTTITGTASSAAIKVQSSATEGGSYADEGTFTFSAIGAYAVALTGTVDRWVRINTTSLGGATSFIVHCVVSVNGVTQ